MSGEPAGVRRLWSVSLNHARTVNVGSSSIVLAGNTNVVLSTTGAPSAGTGSNGDMAVDLTNSVYYVKAAGAWGSAGGTGATRTYRGAVATQAAMLALAIVNVGDWVSRTDLSGQQFELTTAGQATLANWTAVASGVPNQTGALAASATAAPVADTVIAALATKATVGVIGTYATAITATGSVAGTHFGGTLVPVNSASAVQLTVPLDSALALSVLPALSFHAAAFNVVGAGALTFAGATGVTINGIAGPTAVALSFAQFTQAILQQTAANTWTVS